MHTRLLLLLLLPRGKAAASDVARLYLACCWRVCGRYAPLEGVGGVRAPKLDVVELVHRKLIAARVVANEIGVANQLNLRALSSTCAHVVP